LRGHYLPLVDGFDEPRRVRESGNQVPIMVPTGRGSRADVVLAFRPGAGRYVAKPVGALGLLERMRTTSRRRR
jgi:DNA-binding response OmpR family regulator